MAEFPPLDVIPWGAGGATDPSPHFVGDSPWLTTRDDEVSYHQHRALAGEGGTDMRMDFPDIGAAVPVTFVVRSRAVGTATGSEEWINVFTADDFDTGGGGYRWHPGLDWADATPVLFDGVQLVSPAEGGPFSVWVQHAGFSGSGGGEPENYYWTYIAIVTDAAVRPPQRIHPRDDGLFGSAPRNYPPSKTRQRGNRIVGGYF